MHRGRVGLPTLVAVCALLLTLAACARTGGDDERPRRRFVRWLLHGQGLPWCRPLGCVAPSVNVRSVGLHLNDIIMSGGGGACDAQSPTVDWTADAGSKYAWTAPHDRDLHMSRERGSYSRPRFVVERGFADARRSHRAAHRGRGR